MTAKVLKSTVDNLDFDFAAAVEAHRQDLLKHRYTVDVPAPTAHPWVTQCVSRVQYPPEAKQPDDFIADYVIEDDTPKAAPPPSFEQRKQLLLADIATQENEITHGIVPRGKRRLHGHMMREIRQKQADNQPLTQAEVDFVESQTNSEKRLGIIQRRAAEMMAEVEDLTPDTIDAWEIGSFE